MAILTEYPFWLIILCILTGVIYSFILYYKNKQVEYDKKTNILLYTLRGLSITLIAFLILAPLTKLTQKKVDKPIIFFAVDNSESILMNKDSVFYKTTFIKQLGELKESFGKKYEIIPYLIGDNSRKSSLTSIDFSDKSSNISQLFDDINLIYSNRNIGAVLLFSDGIYNVGANPYYKTNYAKYPIYTVGMGNSEIQPDLFIASIVHNNQVFKGNLFPVELKIAANKLKGEICKISVLDGDKEVYSNSLTINNNQFFQTLNLTFEAKEKGLKKFKVILSSIKNEITYKNNQSVFYIEVIDQREKIAILYNAPHPDISAIRSALETSEKYQIDIFPIEDFNNRVDQYSLMILHQLPSLSKPIQNLINEIQKTKVSTLFILGPKSNLNNINSMNLGVSIVKNKDLINEALPVFNENFISFTFSEEAKQMLFKLPPLITPFGDYKLSVSSNVFMYQKIANVNTNYPLIVFNDYQGAKSGIIIGSGLWQWKQFNFLNANNHEVFNEIINKVALYLSVKGDKSRFRVISKNVFNENEEIQFSAELYNESYELQNNEDIEMVLTSQDGKKFQSQFSKSNNSYFLNFGELSPGDYQWKAQTTQMKNPQIRTGAFTVKEIYLESQNIIAKHSLLKSISENTKGKFFQVNEINKIKEEIEKNDLIKPIAKYQKKYVLLLNSFIYFSIILLLLTIEWFLRKWNGSY